MRKKNAVEVSHGEGFLVNDGLGRKGYGVGKEKEKGGDVLQMYK